MTPRFRKLLQAHNLNFTKKIQKINNQPKEETMPKINQINDQNPQDGIEENSVTLSPANPPQADAPETKEQKFSRLANPRMKKILARLKSLKNLSSRNVYSYTPEQAAKIVAALRTAVQEIEDAFVGKKVEEFEV